MMTASYITRALPSSGRIVEDDKDRERFVARLAERVEDFDVRLYLFCLMSNHVHLVCETPEANLGRFMQSLSTAYTVYFNLRHGRHGHLVDGRYRAKLVEYYLLAEDRRLRSLVDTIEERLIKMRDSRNRSNSISRADPCDP